MPTVKVSTNHVTIELIAEEASIRELGELAMDLFRQAAAADKDITTGPGMGFSGELRLEHPLGNGSQPHQMRPTSKTTPPLAAPGLGPVQA